MTNLDHSDSSATVILAPAYRKDPLVRRPLRKKSSSSDLLSTQSGGAGESTKAPKRPAWEDHDISKASGRAGLRKLVATLTDPADVTEMRDSVLKRAGQTWSNRADWSITVEQTLQALDDREKELSAGQRTTAGSKPPSTTTSVTASRGQAQSPRPQTSWNVDDLASVKGQTRLGETAAGLTSIADADTLRAAVRDKARELYGVTSKWPQSVQRLVDAIWARRDALEQGQADKPALSKTKGEIRQIIAESGVRPRSGAASGSRPVRDLDTDAGRDRLLNVARQLTTADDVRVMRKKVWDDARRDYGPVSTWPVAVNQRVSDIRDALVDRQLTFEAAARSKAELDRSAQPEPANSASKTNLTKDWDFDVRNPDHIGQMFDLIPKLSSRDDVDAMTNYVETRAQLTWGNAFEKWSDGAQKLMRAIVDRELALEPPAPTSWEDFSGFAQEFPRRWAYRPPHTMIDHLRQRIGDRQRGIRAAVRVRRRVGDTIEFAEIGADNYDQVLRAAQTTSWTDMSDGDREKLDALTKAWEPVNCPPELLQARTQRWLTKTQVMRTEANTTRMPTDDRINSVVKNVIAELSAWIEPEILDEIGLPKVIVHPSNAEALSGLPAYYDGARREIHIGSDTWSEKQLRHEFGHHVEEQGPVEVWCGLTSFFGYLSDGKPLEPPQDLSSRQPTYGVSEKRQLSLPSSGYARSYYEDAATELVALGLEHRLPDKPDVEVNWKDDIASDRDPRYMAILLQAVRPEMVRKAGVPFPTLL